MTRPSALILIVLATLSGCGEAESPRFVPSPVNSPAGPTSGREPTEKASREVVVPKNIPMH